MDHDDLESLRQRHPAWRLLRADSAAFIASALHRVFIDGGARTISEDALLESVDDALFQLRRKRPRGLSPQRQTVRHRLGRPRTRLAPQVLPHRLRHAFLRPDTVGGEGAGVVGLSRPAGLRRHRIPADDPVRPAAADRGGHPGGSPSSAWQHCASGARRSTPRSTGCSAARFRSWTTPLCATGSSSSAPRPATCSATSARSRRTSDCSTAGSGNGSPPGTDARGALLDDVFGEHDAITASDQGASFQAFWDFLMSGDRQDAFGQMLEEVMSMPALGGPDPRLRFVVHDWLKAADAVQANGRPPVRTIGSLSG